MGLRYALVALVLALGVSRADAQLASAELYVNVDAGAGATPEGGGSQTPTFSDGPRTADVLTSSGAIPWDLDAVVAGAEAHTTGSLGYSATTTSQIVLTGTCSMSAAATSPAAAQAGFDAVAKISFTVAEYTPYTITGYVQTGRALRDTEVVSCQVNGTTLAGDTRATTLEPGTYAIDHQGAIYPGETHFVECDAASSGGTADTNALQYELTVNFGSVTTTTTPGGTTTTTLPLTKKQCRKSCRKAAAACRKACPTDRAGRKLCRKDCRTAAKSCGPATGCLLPD